MLEELAKIMPAVIAVLGVVLGSYVTYKANFKLKSLELKHQFKKQHIDDLRKLGAEYLAEVNTAAILSLKDKNNYFEALKRPNGLMSQIELLATKETYTHAKEMFEILLNLYSTKPDEKSSSLLPVARAKFVASLKKEIKEET